MERIEARYPHQEEKNEYQSLSIPNTTYTKDEITKKRKRLDRQSVGKKQRNDANK